MESMMQSIKEVNDILWGPWTPFVLLSMGILFTIWTKFTQYKAMTHGVQVIQGKYDNPDDPGAINHFQALSAALSATIGLGNIGGVALAIAAGGPGAVFWMWVVGFFGMALKTVEITLAMMYRNMDDPDNPHGGAMWVVDRVIGGHGGIWKPIAKIIGVFFCITLIISTFTGGNMFQAWNVATLTESYFDIPRIATGIFLAILVGLVIVGGIKRIGTVAGKLVPFMCILYVLAGLSVLALNIDKIPEVLRLIVTCAFNPTEAGGAFLGGSLGWAFMQGLKRGLFSNEAGQGSAPIAHAAAKTNESAREGIIGGLGPFIDTICICTLTASVIIITNTWNREPLMTFDTTPVIAPVYELADTPLVTPTEMAVVGDSVFIEMNIIPVSDTDGVSQPAPSKHLNGTIALDASGNKIVQWHTYTAINLPAPSSLDVKKKDINEGSTIVIGSLQTFPQSTRTVDKGNLPDDPSDDIPVWSLLSNPKAVIIDKDNDYRWDKINEIFTVVVAGRNKDSNTFSKNTSYNRHELNGNATVSDDKIVTIEWGTITSAEPPVLAPDAGMYRKYAGAQLTAHAFDRQFPGVGKYLVTFAAWLFALSTMISWSYYGEQGMIYMVGNKGVLPYKLVFLALVIYASYFIQETKDMETWMDLGTGAMLWSNLPIVLCLGFLAVKCLATYNRKLAAGEFKKLR